MSNLQLNLEHTDRIVELTFAPLEKNYLKVQTLQVLLIHILLLATTLLRLCLDDFPQQLLTTLCLKGY